MDGSPCWRQKLYQIRYRKGRTWSGILGRLRRSREEELDREVHGIDKHDPSGIPGWPETRVRCRQVSLQRERALELLTQQECADRRRYSAPGEIEKCRGKWVAFSADGTRVLAAATSEIQLAEKAAELALKPAQYVIEPIPEDDTLLL